MIEPLDSDLTKEQEVKEYVFKIWPLLLWGGIFALGQFFKTMHWPGGNIILIVGASGFSAYNIYGFIHLTGKHVLNNICCFLIVVWIAYFNSSVFGVNYILEAKLMHVGIFLFILLCYWITGKVRKKRVSNSTS